MLCETNRDSVLWLRRWIGIFVGLNGTFQLCYVSAIGAGSVDGVVEVFQLEGLADGAKRCLNRASADLMSSSCEALSHIFGKATEESRAAAAGDSFEIGVHVIALSAPLFPVCPVSTLDFGSLISDPIGSGLLRSKEHTHDVILHRRRSSCHDAPCERGKR